MMRNTTFALVLGLISLTGLTIDTPTVTAGQYAAGTLDVNGYTFRDGFWWKGGLKFNRTTAQEVYYYYQGYCRFQGTRDVHTYQVVLNAAPKKDAYVTPSSEDNWRARLLEIAKQRDKYEAQARASALEQNEFAQSLKILGLDGNFRYQGYGYNPSYAFNPYNNPAAYSYGQSFQQQGQGYSQLPAAQGSTLYGYRELADVYGNVDLGSLYDQVLRLRQQSYTAESKATSETHALVGDLGTQLARVMEIQAKADAAAKVLQAATPKDRATILREFWAKGSNSGTVQGNVQLRQPAVTANYVAIAQQVANTRCVSCHSATNKQGGLDLSDLSLLNATQGRNILDRIVHKDPSKRMPLKADLSPGEPLSREEVAAFYMAAYGAPTPPATPGEEPAVPPGPGPASKD